MAVVAAALVATAAYAHTHVRRFTRGRLNVAAAHTLLIIVGVASGAVGPLIYYRTEPVLALLTFLMGFGVVHVPAALILFIKQTRHSGKT